MVSRVSNKNKAKLLAAIFLLSSSSYLPALTVEQYLEQVSQNNDSYEASKLLADAGFAKSEEGLLILTPHLIANAGYKIDNQPPVSSALNGIRTQSEIYNIGVAKKFSTGTNVKLSYDNNYQHITHPNPSLVKHQRFWYAKPDLSLEQPLLRDWLGNETKALIKAQNASAKATGHQRKFQSQTMLAEAKKAYWDLATIKANLKVKNEGVARAKQLLEWAKKRKDLGLGQESDYLQAESSLLLKQFDFEADKITEQQQARLFNALRNIASDTVTDTLESFNKVNVKKLKPPLKDLPSSMREDLKASYESAVAKQNVAIAAHQKISPDVKLRFNYFPSGRDTHYNHTAYEALRAKHNTVSIGLDFDILLDLDLNKTLTDAYRAEARAAELEYVYNKFQLNNEWQQLTKQFTLLNNQLDLAKKLQDTQEKKLKNEQKLLKNGRTTTFQVLSFEQEYISSQSYYFTVKNKLLDLVAAMELFGTPSS